MLLNEIKLMRQLDHPNICQLIEVYENDGQIIIILEYISGERLFNHIIKRRRLTERETAIIVKQLCMILKYLEEKNILHRDIKPENIFLTPGINNQIHIKLIDFG